MGRPKGSLNIGKITVDDIRSPREWDGLTKEAQAFFVEFECFLVLRQLLELHLQPRHILDVVAISLMKHNRDLLPAFREELLKTNEKFVHPELFNATLCKYLWSGGVGINKIMKSVKMSQTSVYRIAYHMHEEQEKGYFRSNYMRFMDRKFLKNLDHMMDTLRTMGDLAIRTPNLSRNEKGVQQLDIIRQNLRKRQVWH